MPFPLFYDEDYGYYDEQGVINDEVLKDPRYAGLINTEVLNRHAAAKVKSESFLGKFVYFACREALLMAVVILVILYMIWKFQVNSTIVGILEGLGTSKIFVIVVGSLLGIALGYDAFNAWMYRGLFIDIFNQKYKIGLEDQLSSDNIYTKMSPLQIYSKAYDAAVTEARFEDLYKPQPGAELGWMLPIIANGAVALAATAAATTVATGVAGAAVAGGETIARVSGFM